jgi:hypothetical protein
MKRVSKTFKDLRSYAARYWPKLDGVELRLNEHAGRGHRQFAWCEYDEETGHCVIAVASKLEEADGDRVQAIIRHELGHALDFLYGRKALERKFRGSLPVGPERRADLIAQLVFGDIIRYDREDVQTLDANGVFPRPHYLPR